MEEVGGGAGRGTVVAPSSELALTMVAVSEVELGLEVWRDLWTTIFLRRRLSDTKASRC
jgi:hypothetical protein